MQVVLATDGFAGIGGSETYLLTVADELLRLGHAVTIHATRLGEMSELARTRGIDIAPEVDDLPSHCDVVLSQDGGMAYTLAELWPKAPHVYVAHSDIFDFQMPPLVPGTVGAVVVMSDRMAQRVRAMDIPYEMVRLRQPIDADRLIPRGAPNARPKKALLLGNYLRDEARRVITETWSAAGVEVVQVGQPTTTTMQPEDEIAAADIVVGKGRALLDAMACGRPAYLFDAFGTDGWVTPETYPAMEADAFAGQALDNIGSAAQLRQDLEKYDPLMGQVNRELILNNHQAREHVEDLVALFQRLVPCAAPASTPNRELARLIRRRWQAELELFVLRNQFGSVQAEHERELAARVDEIKQSYEAEFAAAQARYEQAQQRYEEALTSAREDYERGLAVTGEQHERDLAAAAHEHEQALIALRDNHKQQLAQADERIQELTAQRGVRLGLVLGRMGDKFRRR
ncbi:hypothetical protein JOF56_006575 [Kibdelosporangium banguiense]|uniref:Glycosyltransferase subfamily 4-like N-terminal domain-containing protein n=1 Tax=Kibdelosporangium banguiense TaxID=1365924 RepID=A0ABS4TP56_9PSEU|nr:hypothetical protein [Kibdelosporangium banguiense]MBP2326190.1 hypothetical protein [Kibdelosporangium banguiense]